MDFKIPGKLGQLIAATGLALCLLPGANAVEIAGVRMDDTTKSGSTELKLNGAGIRYKAIFKVYVAGLYVTEKKNSLADIIALPGPKQIRLVILRTVSADSFGKNFMDGINHNSTRAEKTKIVGQMQRFGELFAAVPELNKGDVILTEWVPNIGTLVSINGKRTGDALPDVAFFNALLKIWLGEQPAYAPLKNQLLGITEKPPESAVRDN
jgi:Chalcone isomerase-like